jgi:hypothetical protein
MERKSGMKRGYHRISISISFLFLILLFINIPALGNCIRVEELHIANQNTIYPAYMADFKEGKSRLGIIGGIESFYEKYKVPISRKQFQYDYPYIENPWCIQAGSELTYKIEKKVKECRLVIQNFNKGKIKRYDLTDNKLPIITSKGLYLYIFYVTWEDGYGIFEKAVKVE